MHISDWSSDVCSSDLGSEEPGRRRHHRGLRRRYPAAGLRHAHEGWRLRHLRPRLQHPPRRQRNPWHREAAPQGGVRLPCRSEERRVGKVYVSPCTSMWSPYLKTTKTNHTKDMKEKWITKKYIL